MVSKTIRDTSREVNVSHNHQASGNGFKIKSEAVLIQDQLKTAKRDQKEQFRLFSRELGVMIKSISEMEEAKRKLYEIDGFSPNLILSLITNNPKDGSFSFEEFKVFICEYLGLRAQVDLKVVIDLYSTFKSSGS